MKRTLIRGMLAALACTAVGGAYAQDAYPTRPITLIVPTEPGGGMDVVGRVVGRKLGEILGQTVLVENKPGASGMIATHYVAKATPDGYTLLEGSIGTLAVAPSLYKSINYDAIHDFASISKGVIVSNVLVVNSGVAATTIQQFMELIRSKPDQFNNGLSNFGSAGHMAAELFASMSGVKVMNIAYKGGEGAIADVAKGVVQMSFSTVVSALPLINSGRVRPLAVTTASRVAQLPDVPTLSESVLPGFEATNWYSFEAPAGTPQPVIAKLNTALRRALTDPKVASTLRAQGMEPDPSSPRELQTYLESETAKWARVVKDQHIQAK